MSGFFDRKNNLSVISGDPKKAVVFLFWPLLLSFMVIAVNTYLDSFWVASHGTDASSAVNTMTDIHDALESVDLDVHGTNDAYVSFVIVLTGIIMDREGT